jgi:Prokaryotic membrane lipoprotein lipid attachment site
MKRIIIFTFMVLALTGCADHVAFDVAARLPPVGFWYGLWHGAILPFSWLSALFDKDVAIYAIYNNGGWYDFGYLLGAAGLYGGGAAVK